MKRKFVQALSLALVFTLVLALPAFAAEVKINVNGEQAMVESYLENGVTMIAIDSFARLSGAAIETPSAGTIKITKNDLELVLTVDQKTAQLGEGSVQLPAAPVKSGEVIYIPLRYVSGLYGYEVSWDAAEETVALKSNETRAGMTPMELLVKSTQAVQDVNTYSMEGNIVMDMKLTADGKVEEIPQSITTNLVGQIQNNPMQVHVVQTMVMPEIPGVEMPDMVVETYMTEEKMYIKAPDQEWTVQDMPFPAEFWQEQQDIQSNPIKAAAQMTEMGMLLNYGNDAVIDGKEYYAVNATLDMDKFKEGYQKILEQVTQGMPVPEGEQAVIQQLMDSAKMDFFYTAYINKETLLNDIIKFDVKLDFTMELPEIAVEESTDVPVEMPKEIQMQMDMQGQFDIKDLGEPFTAPDVSKAVPMAELIPADPAE